MKHDAAKSRIKWLKEGDTNTNFFHKCMHDQQKEFTISFSTKWRPLKWEHFYLTKYTKLLKIKTTFTLYFWHNNKPNNLFCHKNNRHQIWNPFHSTFYSKLHRLHLCIYVCMSVLEDLHNSQMILQSNES